MIEDTLFIESGLDEVSRPDHFPTADPTRFEGRFSREPKSWRFSQRAAQGFKIGRHACGLLTAALFVAVLLCAPGKLVAQQSTQDQNLPRQNGTVPQESRPSSLPPPTEQMGRNQDSARTAQQGTTNAGQNDRVGRQEAPSSAVDSRQTTTGTVVSSSRSTLVVRTEDGRHVLFTFDRDAERPQSIPQGSGVRVVSRPNSEGIQVASYVTVTQERATVAGQPGGTASDPVPPEIRRLESQIARQARRFRAGVRAGVGLDPEILTAGVHANLGPFFHPDVWFRPNAEFGFGEVTKQFNLNLEAIYRLPVTERDGRWTMYAGAGPAFNFINRDFEAAQDDDRDIDFSDFDFEAGLNFLVGMENRNGMFFEFKGTAHSSPQVRFLVGYTF